ncbi:MAG: DUF2778 domain-containing protein [Sulfuriferula sp.]|nr:DUF2778 domain-containing protein [Sulfuriferula sp.]
MKYYYSRYWGILSTGDPEVANSTHDVGFVGMGYSGHQDSLNDIHKQNLQGIGPLPAGLYVISKIYNDPERGRNTWVLTPDPRNKMYGRSGFLVHGDTPAQAHSASDGCIIMPYWVRCLGQVGDEIEVL